MYWDDLEEELDELDDLRFLSEAEKQRKTGRGGCLEAIFCLIAMIVVILFL